jgi:hypothetical protein
MEETGRESLKALTGSGRRWMTLALDPFHDVDIKPEGYPDSASGQSIVVVSTFGKTIAKPSGCAGNWDAIVANIPFLDNVGIPFSECDRQGAGQLRYDSTDTIVPELNSFICWTANTDEQLTPTGAGWNPTNFTSGDLAGINGGDEYYQGRVIAQGFEITNRTPELYKNGTVIVGRIPQTHTIGTASLSDDASVGSVDLIKWDHIFGVMPPGNAQDARVMPNSRTWNAADGCYCPCYLSGIDNPVVGPRSAVMFLGQKSKDVSPGGCTHPPNTYKGSAIQTTNMDTTYAFFAGLSNETVLQLTVKTYVEYFPTFNDPYVLLTTPSAPYDADALALYSVAISRLPAGVPVYMNPKGEFWSMALKAVGVAATALGWGIDLFIPGAGVVGSSIGSAFGALSLGAKAGETMSKKQRAKRMKDIQNKQNKGNQSKLAAARKRMESRKK